MTTAIARARPWYRHSWPWLLIAIPFAGVAAGSVVAVYAYRNADVEIVRAEAMPLDKTSWQSKGARP